VELARRESIHRLARAAEHRDNETGEHIRRVGRLARLVAEALGKAPEWQERLLEAAPLHDVGKIGIADDILLKEGSLTDGEYKAIKQHTVIGADLLSGGESKLLRMTKQVARHHHERWDGNGYPDGLEGADIPLAARIVNVVDTFDAMTSDRPYRDALPVETAFEEIEDEAGRQFDPRVSAAALDIRNTLAPFASDS
jgi:putative two-component system response regulator